MNPAFQTLPRPLQLFLVDLYYESSSDRSQPIITLVCRLGQQRVFVRVTGFQPYFYVQPQVGKEELLAQVPSLQPWLLGVQQTTKKLYHRGTLIEVTQLTGRVPWSVPTLRKAVEKAGYIWHEADIPYVHRFLVDNNLRCDSTILLLQFRVDSGQIGLSSPLVVETVAGAVKPGGRSQMGHDNDHLGQLLVAAFDIETGNNADVTVQKLLAEKQERVVAVACCWRWSAEGPEQSQSRVFLLRGDTDAYECRLLKEFQSFVLELDPDLLVGYNSDGFDWPYLLGRHQRLGLDPFHLPPKREVYYTPVDKKYRASGKALLDLLPKTRKVLTQSGRKTLAEVSAAVFPDQTGKLELEVLPGVLWHQEKLTLLTEYVKQDSQLTLDLFFALVLTDVALGQVNGIPLSDCLLATHRVNGEFELIRILYEQGTLVPPKPDNRGVDNNKKLRQQFPHTGGHVMEPTKVTGEHVIIADFASMYPTMMTSRNIGSETFLGHKSFDPSPQTALALLQERVIRRRFAIKERLRGKLQLSPEVQASLQREQKALKLVANSMYGATLYVQGRFFDIEVCNSITDMARDLMKELFGWVREWGLASGLRTEVVYSDTDSVFVEVGTRPPPSVELEVWLREVAEGLLAHLNDKTPEGMELTLEDLAQRILFQKMVEKEEIRKKAYTYFSLVRNEVVVKGFEAVRTDLSDIAKQTQQSLFRTLLTDDDPYRAGRRIIREIVNQIRQLSTEDLLSQVTFSGVVRRSPKKYKTKTPALGAFLHYCKVRGLDPEVHWTAFDRFPFIISTAGTKDDPLYLKARHPDDLAEEQLGIDKEFYIKEIIGMANRFGLGNPLRRGFIPLSEFLGSD